MSYENFITKLFNVNPSDLLKVTDTERKDGNIILRIRLVAKYNLCPICRTPGKIHAYYKRELKHSTFSNRPCVICYEQRRYICPECATTFSESNPFINTSERVTYETKIVVLKDLKHPEATYKAVADRYNLSPTKVMRIFDKHVDIDRKPLPKVLSIDEHYFPNSDHNSKYCCLLMDFETGVMLDILPDRKKNYLVGYFSKIKHSTMNMETMKSELDNVQYVSIDMYDTYRDVASIFFPKAKVCADSFHVLKHLTDDFRRLRVRLARSTENPVLKHLLVKFRYVFDHNKYLDNEPRYNKSLGMYANYRTIRDILFEAFEDLRVAYELKEYYIRLNATTSLEDAPESIAKAIKAFESSGIDEYEEFYKMLQNWRGEVINSFTRINGRRINNSYMESKNKEVGRLIFSANGFKNFKRTRNRMLYCLNGEDTFKI